MPERKSSDGSGPLEHGRGQRIDGDDAVALALIAYVEQDFIVDAVVEERLGELSEYVEEIDSDVSDLEEVLFSEEEEELDEDADDEDEDADDNSDGMIEYECPHCGTVIFFDEDAFDMEEEHLCPNCHRKVFEEDEDPGEDGE